MIVSINIFNVKQEIYDALASVIDENKGVSARWVIIRNPDGSDITFFAPEDPEETS